MYVEDPLADVRQAKHIIGPAAYAELALEFDHRGDPSISTWMRVKAGRLGRETREGFGDRYQPVIGMVTRLNQKTITVITDDGQHWNVAPHYLRKTDAGNAGKDKSKIVRVK